MIDSKGDYINGYLERDGEGNYIGEIIVDGVNLSPITGVMFKQNDKNYLWLKRKNILEYNKEEQRYISRKREPRWEAYLEKQMDGSVVSFKGEFTFLRFRYSICGIWDKVFGKDKYRLNFFVERLPIERQDIINGLKNRKK